MPIPFTCPRCGRQTIVDDQYAGQRGPCSGCGQVLTVPMPASKPVLTLPALGPVVARPAGTSSNMPVVVIVLVVVAVLLVPVCGGMLLLGLPAVQAAREAARQAQCNGHLKQVSLAMHTYNDAYGCFPPAYVPDENGRPKHSWRVLILPVIEQQALFRQYDFREPFDGPRNRKLASTRGLPYDCPSDPATWSGETDYVMIVGPGTISDGPQSREIMDFKDGISNTIMLIEVSGLGIHWMEPRDITLDDLISRLNSGTLRGPHPGKIQVAMCDGSTRFLTLPINPRQLRAMATIAGRETEAPP